MSARSCTGSYTSYDNDTREKARRPCSETYGCGQGGCPFMATSPPPIHELREALATTVASTVVLKTALDELAQLRVKAHLRADVTPAASTADLPPDGATGLYLDVPFTADDLGWIQLAWDAYHSGGPRPGQIMLVFAAIRRDARATEEFLRVMNTSVLPLLRRLRLKQQPELAKLGAVSE